MKNTAVTIDYYDGKRYWVVIEAVSADVIVAIDNGRQKNFTRSLIQKIQKNFITD